MKKIVVFLLLIIVTIITGCMFIYSEKSYEIEYVFNNFNVKEQFYKGLDLYKYTIRYKDTDYEFMNNTKYSNNRKLIKKINKFEENNSVCISIELEDYKSNILCNNNELSFYDKDKEYKFIKTVDDYKIYNTDYNYYEWNGYGFTNILTGKKYNFLKNEVYNNNLTYQIDKYLVTADYDSNRVFNKIYLFNQDTKKITNIKFKYDISFDSYFMGDNDGYIYLFDYRNSKQYKIDIKKGKVSISSNSEYAYYLDLNETKINIKKLKYDVIKFNYNNIYNYELDNNNLYFRYKDAINKILIDNNVSSFVSYQYDTIYYVVDDNLYRFNINEGKTLLLNNFNFKFKYDGVIYCFN